MRARPWLTLLVLLTLGAGTFVLLGIDRGPDSTGALERRPPLPPERAAPPTDLPPVAPGSPVTQAPESQREAAADEATEARPSAGGRVLELHIRSQDGAPLDGLEASLQLAKRWSSSLPPSTDAPAPEASPDGSYSWTVECGDSELLFVQLWAPGHLPLQDLLDLENIDGDSHELFLRTGTRLRGRVVDRRGQPVFEADIRVRRPDLDGLPGSVLARGSTRADGSFEVGVPASGACRLSADHVDGHASLGLDLPHADDLDVGELVLAGDARISGRVLLASGDPAVDLDLQLVLVDRPRPPGRPSVQVVTDADGRFEAGSLAHGLYAATHRVPGVADFGDQGLIRAGGAEVVLELLAHEVRVRAADEAGAPLDLDLLEVADATTGEAQQTSFLGSGRREVVLLLGAGSSVRLQGKAGELQLVAGQPLVVDGTVSVVELRPAMNQGSVEVSVTLPGGGQLVGFEARLTLAAGVHSLDDLENEPAGRFPAVPPGTYELVVEPSKRLAWDSRYLVLGQPRILEVRAGERTSIQLEAALGGRLVLDLSGLAERPGRDRLRFELRPAGSDTPFRRVKTFVRSDERTSLFSPGRLLPGRRQTTVPALEPGPWEVRITRTGHLPQESTVQVVADETTVVVVAPVPE